jgi:hypothetical protein
VAVREGIMTRDFHVVFGEGVRVPVDLDLTFLGTLKVKRDELGIEYFNFPPPFEELRIFNNQRISQKKLDLLVRAVAHFAAAAERKHAGIEESKP